MELMAVSLKREPTNSQCSVPAERLVAFDQALAAQKSLLEAIVLATCNRVDVYAVVDQVHTGRYYIRRFLAEQFHVTLAQLDQWVTVTTGDAALTHVLRVVCGLEAKILGEPQVLGQFKTAYFTAQAAGTCGALLKQLGNSAIAFAKRMHGRYKIAELAQSAGQAGLHQLKTTLAPLGDKRLLIVGAGSFGQHVLQNATGLGFERIYLTNRHLLRATSVAAKYANVAAVPFDQLLTLATEVDAIILVTSAQQPVLTLDLPGRLRVVIDLGVPHNAGALPQGVQRWDLAALTAVVDMNAQARVALQHRIEQEIPAAVAAYDAWVQQLHVVPLIRQLRESALSVEETVYTSLINKLPELDDREQKIVAKHLKSIINQLLRTPIKTIKEVSVQDDAASALTLFSQLFALTQPEEARHVNSR